MQSLKEQLQHGGGVSLSFSGNFYNGYFDTAKTKFNTLGIKWRYREAGSSTWSAWTSLVLNTGFKYGTGNTYFSGNGTSLQEISLGTGFNYKKNYIFELCYNDKLSSVTYSQTVKEGEPCFDYGKDKNGNNYLNVNGEFYKKNEKLIQTNMITFAKNNDQSLAKDTKVTLELNEVIAQIGDKLSTSNYGVKIGKGVSKVKVSGIAWIEAGWSTDGSGYRWLQILKNGNTYKDVVAMAMLPEAVNVWGSPSIPSVLVEVKEGDLIFMAAVVSVDGSCRAGSYGKASTYLTVEVVE